MASLDEIGLRCGTDKSSTWHNYTPRYERYLSQYPAGSLLLEIGVAAGGSLAMWRQWRPSWRVIGIDCDAATPADFHGDATDPQVVPAGLRCPDILIDDGSHCAGEVIRCFLAWWPLLRPGGVYVVEDLHCSYDGDYTPPWEKRPVDFLAALAGACMERGSGMNGAGKRAEGAEASDVESVHFHKSICFVVKKPLPNA
jgi:hypothetical protein